MAGAFGRVKKQVGSLYTDPFRGDVIFAPTWVSFLPADGEWSSPLAYLLLESTLPGDNLFTMVKYP